MKITFAGTSHGVPAADRFCSCYVIESNGKLYMVDAGAPATEMILRHGGEVKDFRALFTTHVHGDHTLGMISLVNLLNWYYKDCSADIFVTEQAHIDSTLRWIETARSGHFDSNRIRMKVPEAGVVYEDENIKVEYIPNKHLPDGPAYSILITEGDTRVLFGGDFSGWLKGCDIPAVIKEELDLFVCEMAHFGLPEIAPYLEDCHVKKLAFTHVYPLEKYEVIEGMKGNYPFEIITPKDDDVVEV